MAIIGDVFFSKVLGLDPNTLQPLAPAAPIETSTPFAVAGGGGPVRVQHSVLAPDAACTLLADRAKKYGALDPQPAIRAALVAKCENYQRANHAAIRASNPDEGSAPGLLSSLDTNTKIALGIGALIVGAIAVKKLRKKR